MTFHELSTPEDARVDLELELGDLRAELADARRLHESEKRYLESIIADLTARLALAGNGET